MIPNRKLWLALLCIGLLLLCGLLLWSQQGLTVVIYNNSERSFQHVSVSIGNQNAEVSSLNDQESVALHFRPASQPADIQVIIEADPPLQWKAPSLAAPGISIITLHIDRYNDIRSTQEKSWTSRFMRLLD